SPPPSVWSVLCTGAAHARTPHSFPTRRSSDLTGFAVNGLLHLLIGGIAISVAFGFGGDADQGGALSGLASTPGGGILLWVVAVRSEEHTSELQSRENLVCRLLLEEKTQPDAPV